MRRILAALTLAVLGLTGCSQAGTTSTARSNPVASVSAPATLYRGLELQPPLARPDFTLTDTSGAAYDFLTETAGRPTFLFFGYTTCPDICPTTMADVATAVRELPAELADQVRVVFVTTDPAADTGATLATFLGQFDGGLPNGFIGLTGTISEVEAAQRAARVPVAQDMGKTHSAELQLYGPDDLARVVYVGGSSPADMTHDLPLIMQG